MIKKPTRDNNHAKEIVINEATKIEKSPLNFQISAKLHSDFKAKTAKEGKKMREVLEQLINEYTYEQ